MRDGSAAAEGRGEGGPRPRRWSCGGGGGEKGPAMAGRARPSLSGCHCRPLVVVSCTDSSQKASQLGVLPSPRARRALHPCAAAETAAPSHRPRHGPPHPRLPLG